MTTSFFMLVNRLYSCVLQEPARERRQIMRPSLSDQMFDSVCLTQCKTAHYIMVITSCHATPVSDGKSPSYFYTGNNQHLHANLSCVQLSTQLSLLPTQVTSIYRSDNYLTPLHLKAPHRQMQAHIDQSSSHPCFYRP